jgi:hypothetical protein
MMLVVLFTVSCTALLFTGNTQLKASVDAPDVFCIPVLYTKVQQCVWPYMEHSLFLTWTPVTTRNGEILGLMFISEIKKPNLKMY